MGDALEPPGAQPDPGLQPQRTALAWQRTALAVFVNALLLLRAGAVTDGTFVAASGVVLLIASLWTFGFGIWRAKRLLEPATQPARAQPGALIALVALVLLGSVAAVLGSWY